MKLKRLLRWRLKTLLLLTAVLAALLALWIQLVVPYTRQQIARKSLDSLAIEMMTAPASPQWLTKLAPDTFVQVVEMRSRSKKIDDETIAPIADMPFVQRLYLNRTSLRDDGLRYFGNLKHLQRLSLWGTRITDDGIGPLRKCSELVALDVHETGVTDRGLELLVDLPRLRELIVGDAVQGPGLASVAKMPNLVRLDLSRSDIDFDALHLLAGSPLSSISLAHKLPARVCDALVKLPNLRAYNGQLVHVDDQTAQTLTKCTRLETVDLAGVGVTDQATKTLVKLPRLQHLFLHGALTDETLKAIAPATQIKSVRLAGRFSIAAIEQLASQRPNLSIDIRTVLLHNYQPPSRLHKLRVRSLIRRIDFIRNQQRAFIDWPATLVDFAALDTQLVSRVRLVDFVNPPTIPSAFQSGHQLDWSLQGIDALAEVRDLVLPRLAPSELPKLSRLSKVENIVLTDDLLTDQELDSVDLPESCNRLIIAPSQVSRAGVDRLSERHPHTLILAQGHGSFVEINRWQSVSAGQSSIADIMRFPNVKTAELQDVQSTLDFSPLADHPSLAGIAIHGWMSHAPIWKLDRDLPTITSLFCDMQAFNDAQMDQLAHMPNLRDLILHYSNVTDAGLAALERTSKLNKLSLHSQHVTGSGFQHLASCRDLQHIQLVDVSLKDRHLSHLTKLSSLAELRFDNTRVGDEGCRYLARIPNLQVLDVSKSSITDEGLKLLAKCPKLTVLSIGSPQISVAGLREIANCATLQVIAISGKTSISDAEMRRFKAAHRNLTIK